jgi:hypothetical protein
VQSRKFWSHLTRKEIEKLNKTSPDANEAGTHRDLNGPQAHANLISSRSDGVGDGGEPGGRAVAGSDARAAPPHEVQLQARQAPHPHRYRNPPPCSSSSVGGRWVQTFAVECNGRSLAP